MITIAKTLALVMLISANVFRAMPECEAQSRGIPAQYDYYSLALTSILDSAAEASKVSDVPQRVSLLINAARILPAAQHDDAVRLLEVALRDVKAWGSEDKAGWNQRSTAATLRNEVLALYSHLDPERVEALRKESQAEVKSTSNKSSLTSLQNDKWFTQFLDQTVIADQSAKIALSLLDTDPDSAVRLVDQSLQGGTVSGVLFDIVQKLSQNGNRVLLNKIEMGIGGSLSRNVSLDPTSISRGALLILADKEMPPAARSGLISFLMNSLQSWSNLVKRSKRQRGARFVLHE